MGRLVASRKPNWTLLVFKQVNFAFVNIRESVSEQIRFEHLLTDVGASKLLIFEDNGSKANTNLPLLVCVPD